MLRSSFLRGVSALAAAPATTIPALPSPQALGPDDLIDPASMRADLDWLIATLIEVGVAPFRTSSQPEFRRRATILRDSLATALPLRTFYLEVAALFASLNDGHCGIGPTFYVAEYDRGSPVAIPLDTSSRTMGSMSCATLGRVRSRPVRGSSVSRA